MQKMERVTGIWLDFDKAYLYHLQKGKNDLKIITSDVEHYHLIGGSGSSTPYGPQEAVSEKRFLERKKHQTRNYYKRISDHLNDSMEVVVMGPAEAKIGLMQYLSAQNNRPFTLHKAITLDSMTENQLKAAIRDFYRKRSS